MTSQDPRLLLPPQPISISFDLEGADAGEIWTRPKGRFFRLAGASVGNLRFEDMSEVFITPDIEQQLLPSLALAIRSGGVLAGHHIMGFDLLGLAWHHDFPRPWQLLLRGELHDSKLIEALLDPPSARMNTGQVGKYYSLDEVNKRRGFGGKTGDLKVLAKEFGGFDRIPRDEPRYRDYLTGDVVQTTLLARAQHQELTDAQAAYARREHRVAALAAEITLNGFRVNRSLLLDRVKLGRTKRAELLQHLRDEHGLPTKTKDGKKDAKSPQATEAGKWAIFRAFRAAGVPDERFPRKTSDYQTPDLSKESMELLATWFADNPDVVALTELVRELNGVRSIYETVFAYLTDDDRVHPSIDLRQASGRWSVTQPGLTVVGKHGGRVRERDIFIAEPGHVILTADLSQVDARVVAVMSQDPDYMQLLEPGRDMHTEAAITIFGDPSFRQATKALNHAANYGQGAAGASRTFGIPMDVAERYYAARAELYPGLLAWQAKVREQATYGELLDNGWGRKLRVERDRAWTQAPALSGQSGARDVMMQGMIRLGYKNPDLLQYLRCQVHDELVMSVPEDDAEDIRQEVLDAMQFEWAPPGVDRPIQILAEATIGKSTWASAYAKEQ